jgi:hypothetical protein
VRYDKAVFKVVDLVCRWSFILMPLLKISCFCQLICCLGVQEDYADEDEEYEEKLKKESITLFFLAT